MPRHGGKHVVLVKGAEAAMRAFKVEIAQDLGLAEKIDEDGSYKNLSTTEVGQIGGEMVRRIQAAGEWAIKKRFENNEERLMPKEAMPDPHRIREVTNNGNPTLQVTGNVHETPGTNKPIMPLVTKGDKANLPG